jgi:hypothetical protein
MSNLKVNTLQNINGVEVYTCKAWVNFNGTGTVAIRGSGNVSSITDNGTGIYTVNFTTAMPDANYAVNCMVQNLNTNGNRGASTGQIDESITPTTSAVKLWTAYGATAASDGSKDDCPYVLISVFR